MLRINIQQFKNKKYVFLLKNKKTRMFYSYVYRDRDNFWGFWLNPLSAEVDLQ